MSTSTGTLWEAVNALIPETQDFYDRLFKEEGGRPITGFTLANIMQGMKRMPTLRPARNLIF